MVPVPQNRKKGHGSLNSADLHFPSFCKKHELERKSFFLPQRAMPKKENPDDRDDEEDADDDEGEFCAEVGCRAGSLPRTRQGRLLQKCLSSQAEVLAARERYHLENDSEIRFKEIKS